MKVSSIAFRGSTEVNVSGGGGILCRDTVPMTLKGVERPLVASSYWLRLLPGLSGELTDPPPFSLAVEVRLASVAKGGCVGLLLVLLKDEAALDKGMLLFGVDKPSEGFRFITLRAVESSDRSGERLAGRLLGPRW